MLNQSYALFLDDTRKVSDVTWLELPKVKWLMVKNYNQFVDVIEEYDLPEIVSFDRDLDDEHYKPYTWNNPQYLYKEKTGEDCLRWLMNFCETNKRDFPQCYVHTQNPVARLRMFGAIKDFKTKFPNLTINCKLEVIL